MVKNLSQGPKLGPFSGYKASTSLRRSFDLAYSPWTGIRAKNLNPSWQRPSEGLKSRSSDHFHKGIRSPVFLGSFVHWFCVNLTSIKSIQDFLELHHVIMIMIRLFCKPLLTLYLRTNEPFFEGALYLFDKTQEWTLSIQPNQSDYPFHLMQAQSIQRRVRVNIWSTWWCMC
jgi:hypothetical protein